MAVDPARLPNVNGYAIGPAGVQIDLARAWGAIYIRNTGTNPCWVVFGAGAAAPALPAATDGLLRLQIPGGGSINLDDTAVRWISAITAGVTVTALNIVTLDRPGNAGYGAS